MKKSWFLFWGCMSVLLFSSFCNLPLEDCEKYDTGILSIENSSQKGKAYKIIIDGINYGIIGPGDTKEWTLSSGQHMLQILDAATDRDACTVSFPTVIRCKTRSISCDG